MAAALAPCSDAATMASSVALMDPDVHSRVRRVLVFRGVLLLAFGLCEGALLLFAFRVPHITVSVLVAVMTVFLLADGLATLVEAHGTSTRRSHRLLAAATALAGIAAGAMAPLAARGGLLTIFAWWAIVCGLLDIGRAFVGAEDIRGRLLVGAISVAFGLFVLSGAVTDNIRLVLSVSIFGIVAGSLRLTGALARRG